MSLADGSKQFGLRSGQVTPSRSAAWALSYPSERNSETSQQSRPYEMSEMTINDLPEVLKMVQTKPLFVMRLNVRKLQIVGPSPGGLRRVGVVFGGTFTGERVSGEVLDGGNDWQIIRGDGSTILDVRLVLRTADSAMIGMTYRGIRRGPAEIVSKIESGEVVDPASYYFRIAPFFETSSAQYDWLNGIVAVGIGHRLADGPVYSVFEMC